MKDHGTRKDFEDTVEDALGFNFRSIRTLKDLLIHPNRVFKSYAERDRETYTPALRLWFGLIGIQVIISTLWGGWGGIMKRQLEANSPRVREVYVSLTDGRLEPFYDHYGSAMNVLMPIVISCFSALGVFLLSAFGVKLSWPARLNIAMGILVAGSVIGLLYQPAVFFDFYYQYPWTGLVVVMAAYFLTFYRGAPGVLASTKKLAAVKAFGFSLGMMVLIIIGSMIMQIAAVIYAVIKIGPPAG
ncbi:DUF3667 domain-containing protein [Hyphomonas pacifica]|uniref:Yip1 domain-containing protein n=1 Tax=Hyphomonas pacifica TaxID=1280941 RepID=A0A062TTJ2_9PROT|nr:DUF3667 domain-containing protein [Hyphomonas pacifica]KCZ51301.1 hypothetical protein HY2_11610 [Hyphomonas pacifica]RAN33963.1 hypothetical protein HY3_11725 [Hyphomonas pacifica]RAN36620.1 hypothetical protein HY11_11785 [Hyphomonas pacifica]